MRLPPRLLAVGYLQNVASFLAWSVIPTWCAERATSVEQGLLPVVSGVTYILTALRAGRLSDRLGRERLARIGFALFAAFCVLAWLIRSVPGYIALGALNGFAMALIWPGLQARIGDASTADDLERNLGLFSVCWSAGKTTGFVLFASVYGAFGIDALLGCAAAGLALIPLLPAGGGGRHSGSPPLVRDDHHPPALRAAHLRVGLWANFAAYGIGSTLVYLYPKLLEQLDRPAAHHGYVLGAVFLAQTAGFWLFGRFAGWRYRLAPVAIWLAVGGAGLLVLSFGATLAVAIPVGLVLGLGLGQAYMASVYYSVHSEEDRGARAGIHEAVIGAGDCGIPLLGGLALQATGNWVPAAGCLAAGFVGVSLVAASIAVRRRAT